MSVYTLGSADMPITDANVVSRDAVDQIHAMAASQVVTPSAVAAEMQLNVAMAERTAQQIAWPDAAGGGITDLSIFGAPRPAGSYASGCGTNARGIVPGTGYGSGGAELTTAAEFLEQERLAKQRRAAGAGIFAVAAAVTIGVLAAMS